MSQYQETIKKTIEAIQANTELFYQQKTQEAYQQLQETIGQIMAAMETLQAYRQEHPEFPLDEQRLLSALTDTMNAMEEKDTILMADILEYDFVEYLQELLEEMK